MAELQHVEFDLPLLLFPPGRAFRGQEDHRTVRRTVRPALRAGAGGGFGLRPAWIVRATLVQVGRGWVST